MGDRPRLDARLTALGLAASRSRAQALIKSGVVRVDGETVVKPGLNPPDAARIELTADPNPWVSRAALKLIHALDAFALDPAGAEALDVGASTGGFSEVLLDRGAARVTALDVGRDQLHPRLRDHPRLIDLSPKNARALTADDLPAAPNWIVTDVSFISLAKALPAPLSLAAPSASLVALVKPQFEVGRDAVGKGGIVTDAAAQDAAVDAVASWLSDQGWREIGRTDSPIKGGDGNREILLAAKRREDEP